MFKSKIFKICLLVLGIISIILSIYFFTFRKINKRKKTLELQLDRLTHEMEYIKKENTDLKVGVYNSSKDEFLEKEARMNLGYKKEGETAVILSGNTTTTKASDKNSKSLVEKLKIW
jgi:cell division protein FtsB